MRVVDFESRWRGDFARLNLEWLERWFTVEVVDREVLDDPETHILAGGGRLLFAVDDSDQVLGTVALMRHPDGLVELTKMAVKPKLRGAGIGRKLMVGALAAFKQMGGRELFLETSTQLAPAIQLYESVGFPPPADTPPRLTLPTRRRLHDLATDHGALIESRKRAAVGPIHIDRARLGKVTQAVNGELLVDGEVAC